MSDQARQSGAFDSMLSWMDQNQDAVRQMMERPPSTTKEPVVVYLVVYDRGGVAGAWLDQDRALEYAKNTNSVVVVLPVAADFRKAEEPK